MTRGIAAAPALALIVLTTLAGCRGVEDAPSSGRSALDAPAVAPASAREPTAIPPAHGYTRVRPGDMPFAQPDADGWYAAWEESGDPGVAVPPNVPMGGGYSTANDLARFADALVQARLLGPAMTGRVLTGVVPADYGGHHGYGVETRRVNGIRVAGHQGSGPGVSNQVDFYPDLGYALVVLGNSDADGTQAIAGYVRTGVAAASTSERP